MTTKRLVILGATGGCIDILDTVRDLNDSLPTPKFECMGFLDDKHELQGKQILGVKVLGPFQIARDLPIDYHFITGIGSPYNFPRIKGVIESLGIPVERFETIIHPTASISRFASIGKGSVIYQNVTIATNAHIGNHTLILPSAVISHDVVVQDYCRIAAGVCLSGAVHVGESCYLGTNSAVVQDVRIGNYSLIGMSSVVLRDVAERSVAVGNPAKVIRQVDAV